jgi:hypothetical protein
LKWVNGPFAFVCRTYRDAYDKAALDFDPTGYHRPDIPLPSLPQIPTCVIVRVRPKDGAWKEVPHRISAKLPVPPDPIRVRHDAWFGAAFERLKADGFDISRKETHNRYHQDVNNSEPWYVFTYGDGEFLIGPRKRVTNITVLYGAPKMVTTIRDIALADDVTYEADGHWKSPADTAQELVIHAYTADKFHEYMTLLLRFTEQR